MEFYNWKEIELYLDLIDDIFSSIFIILYRVRVMTSSMSIMVTLRVYRKFGEVG